MATPITITGTLTTLSGGLIQNGTVTAVLQNYGGQLPTVTGAGEIVSLISTAVSNASGVFTLSLYGADSILPGPNITYYQIIFKDSSGVNPIANLYQFTGAGPINLNTFAPLTTVPASPVLSAVLSNPSGKQTITTWPLQVPLLQLGALTDTGISRIAAADMAVGNGVQNNNSGGVRATNYFANDFVLFNNASALNSSFTNPALTGTSNGGSVYPFLEAGNLLFVSPPALAPRDILFGTGNPTVLQWGINRSGTLQGMATNPLNWVPASDLSAAVDTGLSRGTAGTVSIGNGSQSSFSGSLKATTLTVTTSTVTTSNATNVNASSQYRVNSSQIAAANLSNGTIGSGLIVLATSPILSGLTINAGTFNASTAAHTLPVLKGLTAAKPASATQGEIYFATDAGAGVNFYFATATNTWTQMNVSAIPGPGGANKQIQYNNTNTLTGTAQLTFDNVAGNTTLQATAAATVSTNPTAPIFAVGTNYWNGAASASDLWNVQDILATVGANPVATLQFSHSGTTGLAALNIPLLQLGTASSDTGLSRQAAGQINIGNGTQGSLTSNVACNLVKAYDGVSTVDRGFAYNVASAHLSNQGATIAATNLLAAPITGLYRVLFYIGVTTSQSGTPNNVTVNLTWNNGTAQNQTITGVGVDGVVGTFSSSTDFGTLIFAKAGTAIQYNTTASGSFTTGKYQLDLVLQRIS